MSYISVFRLVHLISSIRKTDETNSNEFSARRKHESMEAAPTHEVSQAVMPPVATRTHTHTAHLLPGQPNQPNPPESRPGVPHEPHQCQGGGGCWVEHAGATTHCGAAHPLHHTRHRYVRCCQAVQAPRLGAAARSCQAPRSQLGRVTRARWEDTLSRRRQHLMWTASAGCLDRCV